MNNEALEALKSAVAKAKTMGLKGQDCVPAYIAEVCEAADKYLEALTPEVDLEKLKRECRSLVTYKCGSSFVDARREAANIIIDHISKRGLLRGDVK